MFEETHSYRLLATLQLESRSVAEGLVSNLRHCWEMTDIGHMEEI